ncbi:MAG: hypothetical protein ACJAZO_002568 [Myxococcota bacterium]|jgi:hypothetical protein
MTSNRILAVALGIALASTALANPDTSGEPLYGTVTLDAGFTPDPHDVTVRAGGDTDVQTMSLPDNCRGHIVTAQPDVRVNFTAGSSPFRIASCAGEDTSLIINDPSGTWHCDDDTEGTNPVVSFDGARSGQYDVWVGTYSEGSSQPATVRFTERGGTICNDTTGSTGGGSAIAAPPATGGGGSISVTGEPRYGAISLVGGFEPDPHRVTVLAGGGTDVDEIPNIPSSCAGHIAADRPDFRLNFTPGSAPLRFASCADTDTTLVINDASGNWHCDDDSEGSNPVVTLNSPPSGQYDIWVGTYGDGPAQQAILNVSERGGNLCQ